MSSIRSACDLLRAPSPFKSLQAHPDRFRHLIESSGKSVERLARQISDLLDTDHLTAGPLALRVATCPGER
ncbi:MAG: hypothetical protein FJ314_00990 [SAR202 cluster bacterium]|nr:hypothetical protein [SAR202 cluster bacterium]